MCNSKIYKFTFIAVTAPKSISVSMQNANLNSIRNLLKEDILTTLTMKNSVNQENKTCVKF